MIKFAGCQTPVVADKETNITNALLAIKKAVEEGGAQLVALPEMFSCPYSTKVFREYSEPIPGPTTERLSAAAKAHGIYLIGGSIPELEAATGRIYNTCCVFDPHGALVAKHRKVHLFDVDVPGGISFHESETLSAGDSVTYFDVALPQGSQQLLLLLRVGVGICFDMRFTELSTVMATVHGCQMIVFPGAFNMTTGPAHWDLLLRSRALDAQAYVAGVAPARDVNGVYVSYGNTCVVSPWGDFVAHADEKETILYADIDLSKIESVRQSVPVLKNRRSDVYDTMLVTKKKKKD